MMTGFSPIDLSVAGKAPGQWRRGQVRDSCDGFLAKLAGPDADLRLRWGVGLGSKIPALAAFPD